MLHNLNKHLRLAYKFQISLLLLTLISLFTSKLSAQPKPHFFVETDPSTFAFDGYAAHFRFTPSGLEHWVFGVGTYSMKFPDFIVNMDSKDRDQGWDVKLRHGYGLFTDYYFNSAGSDLFIGGQLAFQNFGIKNSTQGIKESRYSTVLLMPRVGYQWNPFNNGFYIMPWIGIGLETKINGDNSIGNKSYNVSPLLPFATVHFGYSFK